MSFKWVDRVCPLCATTESSREFAAATIDPQRLGKFAFASRKTPEYMHHRLLLCRGCDMLYSSPVPATDELEHAYLEAAYDSGIEARYAARTYRVWCGPSCATARPPSALDIGAGDGALLQELLGLGFSDVSRRRAPPRRQLPPRTRKYVRSCDTAVSCCGLW